MKKHTRKHNTTNTTMPKPDAFITIISEQPLRIGSHRTVDDVEYIVDYYCNNDIYILSPVED